MRMTAPWLILLLSFSFLTAGLEYTAFAEECGSLEETVSGECEKNPERLRLPAGIGIIAFLEPSYRFTCSGTVVPAAGPASFPSRTGRPYPGLSPPLLLLF